MRLEISTIALWIGLATAVLCRLSLPGRTSMKTRVAKVCPLLSELSHTDPWFSRVPRTAFQHNMFQFTSSIIPTHHHSNSPCSNSQCTCSDNMFQLTTCSNSHQFYRQEGCQVQMTNTHSSNEIVALLVLVVLSRLCGGAATCAAWV